MKQQNRCLINVLIFIGFSCWLNTGQATDPIQGSLLAEKDCPALHSIKKQSNPGKVRLTPGVAYPVTGQNKAAATYYQVRIDGIDIAQRWVAVGCGKFVADSGVDKPTTTLSPGGNKDYVLAVSWQAGFCQSHKKKTECANQTHDRFDASNLALHGLWPQPINNTYCGVSAIDKAIDRNKRWQLLPKVPLNPETSGKLAIAMPGMVSNLERHEWIKHGTCYGANADEYYSEAMQLLAQINASPVRTLFIDNVGKTLTSQELRSAFDDAFGPGSGRKISVKCTGNLITELWINLRGEIEAATKMADLLKPAPVSNKTCNLGKIDKVGF